MAPSIKRDKMKINKSKMDVKNLHLISNSNNNLGKNVVINYRNYKFP